jgi:hypothetical protein
LDEEKASTKIEFRRWPNGKIVNNYRINRKLEGKWRKYWMQRNN